MKKLLSIVLIALMVVPFAVMVNAAPPAEPVADTSVRTLYCADSAVPEGVTCQTGSSTDPANLAGDTPELVLKTTADINKTILFNKIVDGAKIVWVGKGYFTNGNTFPNTTKPVVITAHDGTKDYLSRNEDGTPLYMDDNGANKGQFGMFMMNKGTKVYFECDAIFENIVFLNRAAATDPESTIVAKKRLVIDDTVQFATMKGPQYSLEVEEGAYAYLHALGFSKYTGKGTIVVGEELRGKLDQSTFAGFEGQIVYADGTDATTGLPAAPETTKAPETTAAPATTAGAGETNATPEGTTAAPETTKAPEVSKKPASTGTYTFEVNTTAPDTTSAPITAEDGGNGALIGIIIGAVAAVAVAAVVVVVILKKKKAQ